MKFVRFFIAFILVIFGVEASANHVLGGNVSYECLGGDTYGVTVTMYKDCFGSTPAPAAENVFFIPNGCSIAFSSVFALQYETEISDLCPSELEDSSCNGGLNPGVNEVVYYGEVTLDPGCTWTISFASGDYNYFNNMDNALLPTAYLATIIDPSIDCGSSPNVTSYPTPYYCSGEPINHQLELNNPSGYDVEYSFVCPQIAAGVDAPMFEPCDELIPGLSIDPVTGLITGTAPALFGNYAVGVQIDYSSGGVNVGTVYETMTFVIQLCGATPTVFEDNATFMDAGILTVNPEATLLSATEVSVCVGDSLCFEVEASNTNIFRSITTSSDMATMFPDVEMISDGDNPQTTEFCTPTTEDLIGTHVVTIDAVDNACINPSADQIMITINVLESINMNFTDSLICFGETVELIASGDSDYSWNIISGDMDIGLSGSGAIQNVTPEITTVIEVTALNALVGCNQTSTVTLNVALSPIEAIVSNETCNGNDGAIDITAIAGSGNFDYFWPDVPATTEDVNGLQGGDYTFQVTDLDIPGCSRDSVFTLTSAPPPIGSITGDITICEGETADITFTLLGTGPFDPDLHNGTGLEPVPLVNDGDIYTVSPGATTTYTLQSITDSNSPSCDYTVTSDVTITVREFVNASFIVPAAICAGESVDLELEIDQPGTYNVDFTDGSGAITNLFGVADGDIVTVTPATTQDYTVVSVTYEDAPTCPNLTPAITSVQVDPLPTVTLDADQTICVGDGLTLQITLTGTGPWEVYHDYPGEASPINIATANFDWVFGTPPVTTTDITLTNVIDTGTDCEQASTASVTITVNDLPTGSLAMDQTICVGDDATLDFTLNGVGPFDIEWTTGGTAATETGIANGHQVVVSPIVTTTYCLEEITDSNVPACSTTAINSCVTVTVNDLPTVDITGNALICVGDSYDLTVNNMTGTGPWIIDYEIIADDDGEVLLSASTTPIVNGDVITIADPGESVSINVTNISDSNTPTCANTAVSTFDLTVNVYSNVTLSLDSIICAGTDGFLEFDFENIVGPIDLEYNGTPINGLVDGVDIVGGNYTETVTPAVTTVYTITNFVDNGNTCTSIGNDEITLTVTPVPTGELLDDISICPGTDTDLTVNLPAGGPFDIVIQSDDGTTINDDAITGATNPFTYNVAPDVTTTYTLTTVADNNTAAECTVLPNDLITVTIFDLPEIVNDVATCANTAETFVLTFEIEGGDNTSYQVDTGGMITEAGGVYTYTSDDMDPAVGGTWTLYDGNNCTPATITIDPFVCPSITDAGTIDLTALVICEDGILNVTNNLDETLDDNDILNFILFDDMDVVLDQVIVPTWDVDVDLDLGGTIAYDTEYFISAVAGNEGVGGLVDLTDPNLSQSPAVSVTFIETPEAIISGGGTICTGESADVQIDFTGTGPFTIDISIALDAGGVFNETITDISDNPYIYSGTQGGDYTITALSNASCIGTFSGTADVIENPLPTGTLGPNVEFCTGFNEDLDIVLTGTTDWDVSIAYDDGSGVIVNDVVNYAADTDVYNVSEGGTYYIDSITDGNGCTNDTDGAVVTVTENPLPDVEFAFGDSSLCTGAGIELELATIEGDFPISCDIFLDGVLLSNESLDVSPFDFPITQGGIYSIETVTDNNGCTQVLGNSITITETAVPVADAGVDGAICMNQTFAIGSPDNPAYNYEWTPVEGLSDATISNPDVSGLDAGVYVFTVTASEGFCEDTDDVTVTINAIPTADAGEDIYVCFGDEANLTAAGGVDYEWTDNGTYTGPLDTPNTTALTLADTEYTVTVTDAFGCTDDDQVMVFVPEELSASVVASAEVCFEVCDGEIELTVEGGFTPYVLDWVSSEPVDDEYVLDGLCAGDYTYTVTDSIGCDVSDLVQIIERVEYFVDDVIILPPVCFGETDGQIEIVSPTGVEYTLVDPETTNGTGIFNDLPAGSYDLIAVDDFGCITDTIVDFESLSDEMTIDILNSSQVLCVGEEVTFEASVAGGFGDLTVNWYNTLPPDGLVSQDNPFVTTPADEMILYAVSIDENGCASDTLTAEALYNGPVEVFIDQGAEIDICEGECIDLTSVATGGSNDYGYTWVELDFVNDTISQVSTTNVCPDEFSTYVVYADDGCYFTASDTIEVTVFLTPEVQFSVDVSDGCAPLFLNFTNETDPALTDQCVWDFGDGNTQPVCGDISYFYANEGDYYPSLTVTSQDGCVDSDTLAAPIMVHGYPIADFIFSPDPITTIENQVNFTNTTIGGVTYEWNFGGVTTSTEVNPEITIPPIPLAVYDFCLEATNEFGCSDTTCQSVVIGGVVQVFVPNAFSPDNDGLNEIFAPVVSGIYEEDYEFFIFDRWGHEVFYSIIPGEGWNGSFERGDYYMQSDAYSWVLRVKALGSGNIEEHRGVCYMLR